MNALHSHYKFFSFVFFLLQVWDWTSGRKKVCFMLCGSACFLWTLLGHEELKWWPYLHVLHSEQTWRHTNKISTLHIWKLLLHWTLIQGLQVYTQSWQRWSFGLSRQHAQGTEGCWRETRRKKRLAVLAAMSEFDSEQEEDSADKSVHWYIDTGEPTIRTEACPLKWWSKYTGSRSRLASIAYYLAMPATSVPCQRFFSVAGHIVQIKRVSLSSENVNELVCLSNCFGAKE